MNAILYSNYSSPVYSDVVRIVERYFDVADLTCCQEDYSPEINNNEIATADLCISFLAPFRLRGKALAINNFNVHVAPPWFRGFGGIVFAIQQEKKMHGVTIHRMTEELDEGEIIYTRYFKIDDDDFSSLTDKTLDCALQCLDKVCCDYSLTGRLVRRTSCNWAGNLTTLGRFISWLKTHDFDNKDQVMKAYRPFI